MNSRDGLEIFDYLKSKLNLPDNCVEIVVNLKQNDLILVSCKYYPSKDNREPVHKTFDMFSTEQP